MTCPARNGRMLYHAGRDRWEICDLFTRPVAVHCGETLTMKVGDHFLPCRIEMDTEWVVYFFGAKFHLHPEASYWIRMG